MVNSWALDLCAVIAAFVFAGAIVVGVW